jgi:hypothetical protein
VKAVIPFVLIVFAVTGCATLGPMGDPGSTGSAYDEARSASAAVTTLSPPQDENTGPRLIVPATGGAPLIGIPVGGNLFLPVTGGPPVVGIPTSPW